MDKTEQYLEDLKSEDPAMREKATRALWILWHRQEGIELEQELNKGTELMDQQKHDDALIVLQILVDKCPDFSEAHNKLATLLFLMGQYDEAVKECEQVLRRIPHHFGALNGLGMCLYELKRFEEAIRIFQRALEVQPYAQINRTYIARCRAGLN
ncbi:MAG: tetratricopeptide repeat protein [Nitrospinae bacterium]|nr:tetratricopeptide repeat protein [Nitrospinota bacterium]MBL7020077.1 tetratricopeptide repeat protein [Nitrospinaceae bacterium]